MHYENLPLYKKTRELTLFIEQAVRHFSRYHRYQLGADLRQLARELVVLVMQANFSKDKQHEVKKLRDKSEEMKLLIVVGKEIEAFASFSQFQKAAMLATEISRQSQGWLNSCQGKRPESSAL